MRSGMTRRCALMGVAATTALTLTISATAAPAAAATASVGTVAHHELTHVLPPPTRTSEPVPIGAMLRQANAKARKDKPGTVTEYGPYYVCLANSDTYCWGANVNPATDVILAHTGDLGWQVLAALIVYWLIKTAGGGKPPSDEFRVVGYYPGNWANWPTNECLGVWGYNEHPHLGSCTKSRHGIYWEFQCTDSPCYNWHLWDTYSQGFLTTGVKPSNLEALWIHSLKKGDWHTWSFFNA